MEVLLVIIIYFVVIIAVVKRVIKSSKEAKGTINQGPKRAQTMASKSTSRSNFQEPVKATIKKDSLNRHMAKESGGTTALRDDRSNDWLAKQLRDEKNAMYMMSDMFAMKAQHKSSCEAEMIKRFHEDNCDANYVDQATG